MLRGLTRSAVVVVAGIGCAVALCPRPNEAQARAGDAIVFTLKKDFVEKYMDRVTIDVDMKVDKAGKIHSAKEDGEIHVAGRADEVGLPIVAEIMNAKFQKSAVKAMKQAEGKAAIKVKGAWRFWCEHAEGVNQKQGEMLAAFTTSNPSHVFEIHPVSHVAGEDIEDSIGPIEGFKYKKPDIAFTHYENVRCRITPNGDTVTIRTAMAGYNIPEFIFEPDGGKQQEVDDGRFVFGSVRDLDGELLVRKVRCAFIKGTEAEVVVKNLPQGKRLHVVGIPRISLKLVKWRIDHAKDEREPLTWNLPYEIIVVGVIQATDD